MNTLKHTGWYLYNPWYGLNQHFSNYCFWWGSVSTEVSFWDWFPDKSRLLSLYWSASQLADSQNSIRIHAFENHPNVIYI